MSADGTRCVLVKPGDVLVIGNLSGAFSDPVALAHAASLLREQAGIRAVLMCADDVTLASEETS